ncbi:MAG: hypothetical protein ABIS50_26550 [Luteolibacter sp.]|uniref:hypothetical protein n=1 Tax=Luteolibacter sp. TaxID=1962973 RepID=UPI0032666C61
MNDPKADFIKEATRGLPENAELIAAANGLLESVVTGSEKELTNAVTRWQAMDRGWLAKLWRWILYGLLLIVSGIIVGDAVRMLWDYDEAISAMDGSTFVDVFHSAPKVTEEQVAAILTDAQKLLVFGDRSKSSPAEQMKALWDSDPENPSYFAEYSAVYLDKYHKLPEGFLETARRIDPDNAWFTHVAAGVRALNAVKSREQSKAARVANAPLEWDVIDGVALDESLAILRQASSQGHCKNPRTALHREQMKLIPMETPPEVLFAIGYSYKIDSTDYSLRVLGNALAAKAWLTGETGDVAGFHEILEDIDVFLRKCTSTPPDSMTGELVNRGNAFGLTISRAAAADKLGLMEESKRLAGPLLEVRRLKARVYGPKPPNPNADLAVDHGGRISAFLNFGSLTRQIEEPPMLSAADMEPGRLMDHETLSWTGSIVAWAILVCGMGCCALFRFAGRDLTKRLARRLELLIRPGDWLAVCGLGVLLPAGWFVAINRFTPLGGRDLSMGRNEMVIPYFEESILLGLAQFITLALLILFASGLTARWRAGRRLRMLGAETRAPWPMAVAVICAAAILPASGWAVTHPSPFASIIAFATLGTSLLGLLMAGLRCFSGQAADVIRNQVAIRMMVPACAAGALFVISLAPFFKAEAYRWSAKDELIKPNCEHMASSDFDYQMALQMRKKLRKVLGYDVGP